MLLVSGSFEEADLKVKAMSLGRGYVLSQVKVVDDSAWKFSAGGKLLRNVVPWGFVKGASDAFDQVGASPLELDIAACVASQVKGIVSWDRNSHFVNDLGIDSARMGQLLGQIRGKTKLKKVNLHVLYEHPSVSQLASFSSEPAFDSEQEEENFDKQTGQSLVSALWKRMQASPHSIWCELPRSCLSYRQLFLLAAAFQQLLLRTGRGPVAICLDRVTDRMAAMLAVLMEGRAFCVLDAGCGRADQLQVFGAQLLLASSEEAVWAQLREMNGLHCIDVRSASIPLQVKEKIPTIDPESACFHYTPDESEGPEGPASGTSVLTASHGDTLEVLNAWPNLRRGRLKLPAAQANLALFKILLSGGTVLETDGDAECLVGESELKGQAWGLINASCLEDLIVLCVWPLASEASTSLPVLVGQKRCFLVQGQEVEARDFVVRQTRQMMTASSLLPGLLGLVPHSFGENSWPVLCAWVQGMFILLEPVLAATRMMFAERVLWPLTFVIPLWQSFFLLWAIIMFEKIVGVMLLLAAKWVLVGRYQEAKHDIYSLFYLRHWLVERIADGTIIGDTTPPGTSVAFHFLRNLVLRGLGADVALTAMIFTRVVAFDLVSVGHLATVNGSKHLTALNYGEGKMNMKSISVGHGALIGANAVLEPGCWVAPAAHVEALSMVPATSKVFGRVSGVPAQPVTSDPRTIVLDAEVRQFRARAALMASTYWLMLAPQSVIPFVAVILFRVEAGSEDPAELLHFDYLPENVLSFLPQLPLWSFSITLLILALQLLLTALICRLVPRVKPPYSYSLTSIQGQMVSLKMLRVNQASKLLQDASMVAAFMRLCGARIGRGGSFADMITLPDTLVVGNGCFIATRNILTSATVDRGQFKVPCVTHLGHLTPVCALGEHHVDVCTAI